MAKGGAAFAFASPFATRPSTFLSLVGLGRIGLDRAGGELMMDGGARPGARGAKARRLSSSPFRTPHSALRT